jgi:hypothetical protein
MSENISIFTSYSQIDIPYLHDLHQELIILKNKYPIDAWYDGEILPGEPWESTILEKLEESNVILLLVSRNFLSSYYCQEIEFKKAMERHKLGDAHVIPIIVRDCNWKNSPIQGLQILPDDRIPIADPNNKRGADTAYVNIANGLKKIFDKIQSERKLESKPPPQEVVTEQLGQPNVEKIILAEDDLFKALSAWFSNVHRYDGTTENDLKKIYEEVIEISPNLTEGTIISCVRDENINLQFRSLLKKISPKYSDQDWELGLTFK